MIQPNPQPERIDADLAKSIGSELLFQLRFVPLALKGDELTIASVRDDSDHKLAIATATRKKRITVRVWPDDAVIAELRSVFGKSPAAFGSVQREDSDTRPTRQVLFDMIDEALRQHASDIHFEIRPDGKAIAGFRIDRALIDKYEFTRRELEALLNVVEQESKAQEGDPLADGSWTFEGAARRSIDVRVQFLPVKEGRECIMRLVGSAMRLYSLDSLSIPLGAYNVLIDSLRNPHGLHCCVGPTGAGKTTTLAAIVQYIREHYQQRRQRAKIITAESPVEIVFPDVTQVQIEEERGITFQSVIRAFTRSDADLMMIGELNDKPTVDAALNAALIGRQVIASIHAPDALSAIERFKVLGADMTTVSMTLRTLIAQRLIKRLCSKCKVSRIATKGERELYHAAGFDADMTPKSVQERGEGCDECNGWGYNGVVPIFEVVAVGERMRTAIREAAPYEDLKDIAIEQRLKYLPMTQVALAAVNLGECSIDDAREAVFVY